jgi:hypothetical protein
MVGRSVDSGACVDGVGGCGEDGHDGQIMTSLGSAVIIWPGKGYVCKAER